jgi:hypothetical protein
MAKSTNTVPSFNNAHNSIVKAQHAADNSAIKANEVLVQAFSQYIDACNVAGMAKNEESCKAIRSEIVESFVDDIALGQFQKSTIDNYAQGAMRAFFHGGEWSTRAFQSIERGGLPALPWSKKAVSVKVPKSGAINGSTTRVALLETLTKAIAQSRLLNMDSIGAGLIDLALEIDPTFKAE